VTTRVLIAGIGNVFFGDDAFGVEVARRLASVDWPEKVVVRDVGIRGLHLAYDLVEGFDLLVVIDSVETGDAAGTLHLIEPFASDAPRFGLGDAHGMDLASILETSRALGAPTPRVLVVGCDVADVSEGIGLTPAVEAAIEGAARMVESVVRGFAKTSNSVAKEERP